MEKQQTPLPVREMRHETQGKTYNYWGLKPAEQINPAIKKLPIASVKQLQTEDCENINKYKILKVTKPNGEHLAFINPHTSRYEVVQHEPAFRPIINALTVSGVKDFKFSLTHTAKDAKLWLFVDGVGYDSVSIGIEIKNSFCGHQTLNYGIELDQHNRYIELVSFREVCSNGAVIRVPLAEADFIAPVMVDKIKELASKSWSFKHTASVMDKAKEVKYFVEAISLLREPVEAMIKRGQSLKIEDAKRLEELIKLHVGKRYASKVLDQYANENNDIWGLFNAITFVASHDMDLTASSRDTLLDKAANMLMIEVKKKGVTK